MEIMQTTIKIDSIIKDIEHFHDKFNEINNSIEINLGEIEENVNKLFQDIDKHLKGDEIKEYREERKYLVSYFRKSKAVKTEAEENLKFNKDDKIEHILGVIKNIKELNNDCKKNNYKIMNLKNDLNSLKSIVEKDILLNMELNRQLPVEKVEYVYDMPPQLIDSLNKAFENVCIAKDGIERIKVYEDIINNLNQLQ